MVVIKIIHSHMSSDRSSGKLKAWFQEEKRRTEENWRIAQVVGLTKVKATVTFK